MNYNLREDMNENTKAARLAALRERWKLYFVAAALIRALRRDL
jgi:hypothetical protein